MKRSDPRVEDLAAPDPHRRRKKIIRAIDMTFVLSYNAVALLALALAPTKQEKAKS